MNNIRRKAIRNVIRELQQEPPDWRAAEFHLATLLDEEADAMDNTPESLQDTDRYQVCEESVDLLDGAVSELSEDDPESAGRVIDLLEQIDGV